ncbi:MAG: hypothetical protein ACRDQ4_24425 [Pseudonocardiaceae bacterium]
MGIYLPKQDFAGALTEEMSGMDDRDDELVVVVEEFSRVQNRGDFQMSDGAQGDSGDTNDP